MNKYGHLKEKAIKLRENGYSLPDICKMLNKGKSTVHYWIKNIQIKKVNVFLKRSKANHKNNCIAAGLANRKKYKRVHEKYKKVAETLWDSGLKNDDSFKLFIMYYSCEGYRRSTWTLGLCNSDPSLIKYCTVWFKILNVRNKKIEYKIQLHVDQNEKDVKDYWKKFLGISKIQTIRKSNTGKMSGRNWNSKYGVLSILFHDSYMKTMLDTWIDLFKKELVCIKPSFTIKKEDLPPVPDHTSYLRNKA